MEWPRTHPYSSTLAVAAVILLVGGTVVASHSPVAPSQNTITWSGGVPISAYQNDAPQQSPQQIAQDVIQNQAPSALSLPPLSAPSSSSSSEAVSGQSEYVTPLAQSNGSPQTSSPARENNTGNDAIAEAYEFIPTGLVATTAPATSPMTADQKVLYEYGNEVGGEIQSFENLHPNETQILKDQAEDRTDPAKAAALVALGQGFASVGTYLQHMQNVPPSVEALHAALAQSYLDVGAKLQVVAGAQSDADFVQAVESYDDTANTFVTNYAALAVYFSAQGVVFSAQDPGSVFSFTDTGSGNL